MKQYIVRAYLGTLIYSLLGIVSAILSPFAKISRITAAFYGDVPSFWFILFVLINILIIGGYFIFVISIKELGAIAQNADKKAFNLIFWSAILDLTGIVLEIFSWSIASGVLRILSCVLLINAYSSLRYSTTFCTGCDSARKEFWGLLNAEILILIGICIRWIPIIGGIIGGVMIAIAWIVVLWGWRRVSRQCPNDNLQEQSLLIVLKDVITEFYHFAKSQTIKIVNNSKNITKNNTDNSKH